jgi:hypothetical protein
MAKGKKNSYKPHLATQKILKIKIKNSGTIHKLYPSKEIY